MRGRDGLISQKTVGKPFEKAASVDVAALNALLSKTQKRKKNLPRFFSFFPIRRNGKKKRFPKNSETPKARGAQRKKDSPS
jgi:hypothetical protein